MNLVQPRLSKGLRDLLPEDTLARQAMIDVVRGVYELYGFVPLTTPAVEYLDVLSGSSGQEIQESIFVVQNPEEELLGLRFDHTVPLARVIAQYRELPRPFRRYAIGPVWRADKPGPGRFREFVQFDIDAVGVQSEMADTEIIGGICDSLEALGVSRYQVRFSSRRVLNLLLTYASITPERAVDVFRVIDKLEKIGIAKVRLELTSGYTDESGDKIAGIGLTAPSSGAACGSSAMLADSSAAGGKTAVAAGTGGSSCVGRAMSTSATMVASAAAANPGTHAAPRRSADLPRSNRARR